MPLPPSCASEMEIWGVSSEVTCNCEAELRADDVIWKVRGICGTANAVDGRSAEATICRRVLKRDVTATADNRTLP